MDSPSPTARLGRQLSDVYSTQSPPSPKRNLFGEVVAQAGRQKSELLSAFKRPNVSLLHMGGICVVEVMLTVLRGLIRSAQFAAFLGTPLAAINVMAHLNTIICRLMLTGRVGAHSL